MDNVIDHFIIQDSSELKFYFEILANMLELGKVFVKLDSVSIFFADIVIS